MFKFRQVVDEIRHYAEKLYKFRQCFQVISARVFHHSCYFHSILKESFTVFLMHTHFLECTA